MRIVFRNFNIVLSSFSVKPAVLLVPINVTVLASNFVATWAYVLVDVKGGPTHAQNL